ncbi:MAG: hypothetical protein JW801_18070 [Bacteroidales bacterium]|nr:hypothetical protein [Bacteroidales bacterium]
MINKKGFQKKVKVFKNVGHCVLSMILLLGCTTNVYCFDLSTEEKEIQSSLQSVLESKYGEGSVIKEESTSNRFYILENDKRMMMDIYKPFMAKHSDTNTSLLVFGCEFHEKTISGQNDFLGIYKTDDISDIPEKIHEIEMGELARGKFTRLEGKDMNADDKMEIEFGYETTDADGSRWRKEEVYKILKGYPPFIQMFEVLSRESSGGIGMGIYDRELRIKFEDINADGIKEILTDEYENGKRTSSPTNVYVLRNDIYEISEEDSRIYNDAFRRKFNDLLQSVWSVEFGDAKVKADDKIKNRYHIMKNGNEIIIDVQDQMLIRKKNNNISLYVAGISLYNTNNRKREHYLGIYQYDDSDKYPEKLKVISMGEWTSGFDEFTRLDRNDLDGDGEEEIVYSFIYVSAGNSSASWEEKYAVLESSFPFENIFEVKSREGRDVSGESNYEKDMKIMFVDLNNDGVKEILVDEYDYSKKISETPKIHCQKNGKYELTEEFSTTNKE